ncbi:MAG: gallidermin family lantibiotic [Chlamydiales bacterium]|nr:gallidermin family lantibiotic [Chlamydiales bacterium]
MLMQVERNSMSPIFFKTTKTEIDEYDLDLTVTAAPGEKPGVNELITSRSLCTPGCGNTGTNNSFCC